jgi:hypothetical protein
MFPMSLMAEWQRLYRREVERLMDGLDFRVSERKETARAECDQQRVGTGWGMANS